MNEDGFVRRRYEPQALPNTNNAAQPREPRPIALEILDVGDDDRPIPPRQWLLGTAFCREFVSGLIAPGAGAKTSLRIVQALALASQRSLTGEHVFVRCRVLFICLEDGMTELRRRIRAAMIHHRVAREEVKGYLFLTAPARIKVAQRDPKTGAVSEGDLDRAIRAFVDENGIDLVIIDPVKKAHSLEENSNDDMDAVVTIMTRLAIEKNIAVDVLSHERKGTGEAGDANRARGASSLKDGGRLMYTSTWMSEEERDGFNLTEEERRLLFRVDSAKVNLAPPATTAQWFRLVGVRLENGDGAYPSGDTVQAVERWTPPALFDGLATTDLNKALDKLRAGMSDGRRYSAAPSAKGRAAWRVLQEVCPNKTEQQCRAVIKTWVKSKLLTIGSYYDERERKENEGIIAAARIGDAQ